VAHAQCRISGFAHPWLRKWAGAVEALPAKRHTLISGFFVDFWTLLEAELMRFPRSSGFFTALLTWISQRTPAVRLKARSAVRLAAVLALLTCHGLRVDAAESRTKAISEGRISPPYVLNESLLRRVDALLVKDLHQQVKNGHNHFEIVHCSNTTNETDIVADVIGDANSSSEPITSVIVTALGPFPDMDVSAFQGISSEELTRLWDQLFHDALLDSRPRIDIAFGADGVQFSVKGADTAWVIATRHELETLLKSASRSDHALPKLRPEVGILVAGSIFILCIRRARDAYDRDSMTRTNLHRYVWDVRDPLWSGHPVRFWSLTIASAVVGVLCERAYTYSIRYLFPHAVFEFGDGAQDYAEIIKWRSDIFWIVLVGLLVAILGGIIVTWIAMLRETEIPVPSKAEAPEKKEPGKSPTRPEASAASHESPGKALEVRQFGLARDAEDHHALLQVTSQAPSTAERKGAPTRAKARKL